MSALKDLRVLARDYGLPGWLKLRRAGLLQAVANARAAEFLKGVRRAQKTGKYAAIRTGSILDPRERDRRARELAQIDQEVEAALRAEKYNAAISKKPKLRQKPSER